jgi:hypothetical protein
MLSKVQIQKTINLIQYTSFNFTDSPKPVVCFLMANSLASEFYRPTFWKTLSVPSSQAGSCVYPPMKMEQTECSKISAYKIQMPGNYPDESIQHSKHSKILKSKALHLIKHKPVE